jgi:hypothetical protein
MEKLLRLLPNSHNSIKLHHRLQSLNVYIVNRQDHIMIVTINNRYNHKLGNNQINRN